MASKKSTPKSEDKATKEAESQVQSAIDAAKDSRDLEAKVVADSRESSPLEKSGPTVQLSTQQREGVAPLLMHIVAGLTLRPEPREVPLSYLSESQRIALASDPYVKVNGDLKLKS